MFILYLYPCHVYPRFCRVANHQGPGARGLGSETSGSGRFKKTPVKTWRFMEDFKKISGNFR